MNRLGWKFAGMKKEVQKCMNNEGKWLQITIMKVLSFNEF